MGSGELLLLLLLCAAGEMAPPVGAARPHSARAWLPADPLPLPLALNLPIAGWPSCCR